MGDMGETREKILPYPFCRPHSPLPTPLLLVRDTHLLSRHPQLHQGH